MGLQRAMDKADILNGLREAGQEKVSKDGESASMNRLQVKWGEARLENVAGSQPEEIGKQKQRGFCQSLHPEDYSEEEIWALRDR